mgnify:CR=1 FL=1|tara:strand:- start:77 stop:772 length:696 start_codon:yes stop_codon:yes gene_type:complete
MYREGKPMRKIIKVLMVDDHPLIVEGYKNIILKIENSEQQIRFESANNLKQAYQKINQSLNSSKHFDLAFLDINLPEYEEKMILSGEDLALFIRKVSPLTKIIFLTMHSENYRLYNIVRNVNPEGLLIKSDVDSKDIINTFNSVQDEKLSYSDTVLKLMRYQITNNFLLDQFDRQILFHISRGVQTKKLTDVIPLSLPAIEKRKRNLKKYFGLDKEGDLLLVRKAKELGFL